MSEIDNIELINGIDNYYICNNEGVEHGIIEVSRTDLEKIKALIEAELQFTEPSLKDRFINGEYKNLKAVFE